MAVFGVFGRANLISGLIVAGVGATTILVAQTYPLGSATRMGPGYYPTILGILLMFLGTLIILFDSRRSVGSGLPSADWHSLTMILAGVGIFAALIETAGLAPAILACIFVSAQADKELTLKETSLLALAVTLGCILIFDFALGMPVDVVRGII
ncbi:tripartite tricarboxylate transporter TctB family protein [Ruegeria hyattellae]|uniref:tripartite tricarboxylate transporter TctB family protein n=1 Tax=Ruegeria hyattellae TaxID=3233337 RepID=UPI00355B9AE2